jgi:ATP-dependent DNA ligase
MLSVLTDDYFSDPDWIYERKFDGERCLLYQKDNNLKLLSRNHKAQNDFYPEIIQFLKRFKGNYTLIAR